MASVRKSIQVPDLTDAMYANGRKARPSPFDVVAARYSRAYDALQLTLRNEIVVSLPRRRIRELAKVLPADLAKVEVQPGAYGITFQSINVDISVPGLIANELGSLFAREMERKTKGRTSTAKVAASRKNGARAAVRGNRPRSARPVLIAHPLVKSVIRAKHRDPRAQYDSPGEIPRQSVTPNASPGLNEFLRRDLAEVSWRR